MPPNSLHNPALGPTWEAPTVLKDLKASFRRIAGWGMFGFAIIGIIVGGYLSPQKDLLASLSPVITLGVAGLIIVYKDKLALPLLMFIACLLVPFAPITFINNGALSTITVPFYLFLPLIAIGGRLGDALAVVYVTVVAVAPIYAPEIDTAIWIRSMVSIVITAVVVKGLMVTLTKFAVNAESSLIREHAYLMESEALNNNLSKALADLEERREKQLQLFSIISHELRTPLASMKMMQDAMELRDIGEYGSNLCDTTNSLLSIVDDLRTVINPEKAHQAAAVVDSPYDVLTRTTQSLEGLYAQQGVDVKVSSDQLSHSLCKFNAQALRQKITNLTKNAAIHADADTVWVDLQAQPLNDTQIALTLVVEDNGKGIPLGLREAVFGAFSRGDTRAEGTGLGLYITRELAEKLGGTVEYFESDKGGAGFRAEFTLDLHLSEEVQEQVEESIPVALQGKRILFAEDQKTLQLLTSKLLKDAGADVVVCDNGKLALEAFREGEFDIVLTDLMMPEMSGDELIRHIRAEGFAGQVVALTAAIIGKESDTLLEAGADAVLNKPLDIHEMKRTIAALVAKEGDTA